MSSQFSRFSDDGLTKTRRTLSILPPVVFAKIRYRYLELTSADSDRQEPRPTRNEPIQEKEVSP